MIHEGMRNLPESHWPQDCPFPNLPAFMQGQVEVLSYVHNLKGYAFHSYACPHCIIWRL